MKQGTRFLLSATFSTLAFFGAIPAGAQQVPAVLGYQGRVAVGGVNFDGAGAFKFALVNAAGTSAYWSNDGSKLDGSEPAAAVALSVTKGLYSVGLGDTTLPNMTALPADALNHADVRLRVWFNDGAGHGSQLLAPDQRLSAVAYALVAGSAQSVADGAITGAKVADGSIGSAQLSPSLSIGGDFTLGGSLALPASMGSTTGVLTLGGRVFLHSYGSLNTFLGDDAGNFTMMGSSNTALGYQALSVDTSGGNNTAVGQSALGANTTGNNNCALGAAAMYHNTTGNNNCAFGFEALLVNIGGLNNCAFGFEALVGNTSGVNNSAVGSQAMASNTTGTDNTAIGAGSSYNNTTGKQNTSAGVSSLGANTTGINNVAIGYDALNSNTTGSNNICLGTNAGTMITTGNNNIEIGNGGVGGDSGVMRLGSNNVTSTFIAAIRGVTTGANNAQTVVIDSNGQLGTINSSRRYKEDIADMGDASARLQALRPVTFRYKKPYDDGEKPIQFGLIAEEVAETFPELAVFNAEGQPESVKYQDLAPMLLNEYLKEHRQVEQQQAALDQQKQQIETLGARLEELENRLRKPAAASHKAAVGQKLHRGSRN